MKNLFTLLAISIITLTNAQRKALEHIRFEVIYDTGFYPATLSLYEDGKFYLHSEILGCLDENDKLTIHLSNGQKVNFLHGYFSCSSIFGVDEIGEEYRTWFVRDEINVVGISVYDGHSFVGIINSERPEITTVYRKLQKHLMKGELPKKWLKKNREFINDEYFELNPNVK